MELVPSQYNTSNIYLNVNTVSSNIRISILKSGRILLSNRDHTDHVFPILIDPVNLVMKSRHPLVLVSSKENDDIHFQILCQDRDDFNICFTLKINNYDSVIASMSTITINR
ncbi:hypothetical protein TetV_438 [Tetraselmis virus 1]|uniref:Uncharacterized protein n=1 Tax=Tetraselmis virus 1 TaxID=2060617 RepID=A0A2P0VNR8_9VIRU|nr:hypothetical protein QJ968_gp616 [Tetraselmis virus 1]AUF82520.1 hypothetical protein TetV_438 [Tetraselmis virus 1]